MVVELVFACEQATETWRCPTP